MHSRLWEAQDALYAMLRAVTFADRDVTVSLGRPATMDVNAVWVDGGVDTWDAAYRVSGLAAKEEEFTLKVNVYAVALGDYVDARNRVKAMGDEVEAAVVADYTLDGSVMLATISRGGMAEGIMDDGRRRQCLLTLYVKCSAYMNVP